MKNFEGVDAVKFGNLLRTYRKAHKFTQKKVSDYLGVERSALSAEIGKMQRDGLFTSRKNYFELNENAPFHPE